MFRIIPELIINQDILYPIGSMYGIYGNIYHQYTPNVSIYTIHGSYGYGTCFFFRKRRLESPPRHLQVAHLSEDFQVALRCQRLMLI